MDRTNTTNPKGALRIPLELLTKTQKDALDVKRKRKTERERHFNVALRGQEQAFINMFLSFTKKQTDGGEEVIPKGWINKLKIDARTGGSWWTFNAYRFRSIYFLEWLKTQTKHPFALDTNDALEFQQSLQLKNTTFIGKPMTNHYRNMIFDAVRNMYDYFLLKGVGYVEEEILIKLPLNPFKRIPNLAEDTRIKERYLDEEQLEELIAFASEHEIAHYYKIAIWLGLYAGLRISEANTITFEDISVVKHGDKEIIVIKVFGKRRKERETIYVDEATKKSFLDYVKMVKERYEAKKSRLSGQELETLKKLVPVDLKSLARYMFILGQELSFHFHFHRLRHTYGYTLSQMGIPLETIAHLLGHSSMETTRIYAEVDTSRAIQDIYK